jgi:hypothetical protein
LLSLQSLSIAMEKRYQVFVSSTYADLKEERQQVIQTLMEMDCIPAGMELFPASDEDQFNFIKRVIDDCDYYILVIGGRYGSLTPQGISYTEQEFDYAIEKGLRVVAFLHGDPESLSVRNTDNDPALTERLDSFRKKAQTGRLVRYWQKADELPGMVSLSLQKTIKTYPAVGWIRATSAGSTELLSEINDLRKENEALRTRLAEVSENVSDGVSGLAGLDERFGVSGTYNRSVHSRGTWYKWEYGLTWGELFALIGPLLLKQQADGTVEIHLRKAILQVANQDSFESKFDPQLFDTIKIQLKALGLVAIKQLALVGGGVGLFWSLTPQGEAELVHRRTVRSDRASAA